MINCLLILGFILKNMSKESKWAYWKIVCTAILEYHAFEDTTKNETALKNFRNISRLGLGKFIYVALNYDPPDKWKYFHDRVSLLRNRTPIGFYTIFSGINGLIIDLIDSGLTINEYTLPDISVGKIWSDYWNINNLNSKYGDRITYEHCYPEYYPQAKSNPQDAWAYPDISWAEFKSWFINEYLTTKFPNYILKKAKLLPGGENEAKQIANIFVKEISSN